jgi:beta-aspartyl-dipeptidase (metallo-type)
MMKWIRNAELYRPEPAGRKDILVAGGKIVRIEDRIEPPASWNLEVIDAAGRICCPGFVDLHVHLLGGGGEGGVATRTPEIVFSRIIAAGVTTVVGCLGTDDVSRRPEALLAKARQLEAEGITARIYTGSYHVPPATITGSVRRDLVLINEVIGVGEIAVSDHRSAAPTLAELARVSAEARVGGMLGGKAGLVHLHMGDGKAGLDPVFRLVEETDIPIGQFLPTHVNRNARLFEQAVGFARAGGHIDLTVMGENADFPKGTAGALARAQEAGVDGGQISLSSDANGSMPVFDQSGNLVRLAVADIAALHEEFCRLVEHGVSLSDALALVTANPARRIGMADRKGGLFVGADADLLILEPNLSVDTVVARGRVVVKDGATVVKGTFEV